MTPAEIRAIVGDTPHTSHAHGKELYDFIREHRLTRCLELGFAHGVATVWIAGAIQSLGGGKIISVDIKRSHPLTPTGLELVERAGLASLVELYEDPISYTWHLKRNLSDYSKNQFDFVFIDGAHTWDTDGFAFFLVEKILRAGGWVLFDDLNWSFATSPCLRNLQFVRDMPEEARTTQQVRAIWELLVLQHPVFGNFIESGNWGWAQKILDEKPRQLAIRRTSSLGKRLASLGSRIARFFP